MDHATEVKPDQCFLEDELKFPLPELSELYAFGASFMVLLHWHDMCTYSQWRN